MSKITFLGVGAALKSRFAKTSFLMNDTVLVDAGSDPVPALKRLGVDPNSVRCLLITHLHGDHYFGAGFLIAEAMVGPSPRVPLRILGPTGVGDSIKALLALAYPLTAPDVFIDRANVSFQELSPGDLVELDNVTVQVVAADHGRMPALGYRLEVDRKAIMFTGDGKLCPALVAALSSADYWVINTPTEREPLDAHASLAQYLELIDGGARPIRVFVCHRTFDGQQTELIRFPLDEEVYSIPASG